MIARNANVQGTVRVFAIIDENGKVWVTNSEGPALLRRAAEDAARNWNFAPTVQSGRAVRVARSITAFSKFAILTSITLGSELS